MIAGPLCRKAWSRATRRHLAGGLALAVFGATVVSGCGADHANGPSANAGIPAIRASLATSIETSAGYWATVAMGHLDEPLNTFWQLLFRPAGAAAWSDRASALAVATNGGLVIATQGGRSLVIGIRPSVDLEYSPLIATSDARSWTPSGPVDALADEPDALAIAAGGEAMALVGEGSAARVLASREGLAGWYRSVTEDELATSEAGRACGVVSLTAVGYAAGNGLLGANCRRDGVVGIFLAHANSWRLVGPVLARPWSNSGTDVLGLQATKRGLCALVAATPADSTDLVVACTSGEDLNWKVSAALPLAGRQDVVSFGPAGDLGLYALVSGSSRRDTLAVLVESKMTWRSLPAPPSATAVVVFEAAGRVEALSVADSMLTDWVLTGSVAWRKAQELHVAIQFGSSG